MADTSGPRGRQFLSQVAMCPADLPIFLTAPAARRWHLRWGSTPSEVAASLPGDALLQHAHFRVDESDHHRRPTHRCLRMVGAGRLPARRLLQQRSPRQPAQPRARRRSWPTYSISRSVDSDVAVVDAHARRSEWTLLRSMLGCGAARTHLGMAADTDRDRRKNRLVARLHANYDWRHPLVGDRRVVLMEFGDFTMMRRMLRGIKTQAIRSTRTAADPGASANRDRPHQDRSRADGKANVIPRTRRPPQPAISARRPGGGPSPAANDHRVGPVARRTGRLVDETTHP